jgi:hypothetical protein
LKNSFPIEARLRELTGDKNIAALPAKEQKAARWEKAAKANAGRGIGWTNDDGAHWDDAGDQSWKGRDHCTA